MPRLESVQVWSNLQCAAGTRLGVCNTVTQAKVKNTLTGDDELSFVVSRSDNCAILFRLNRVVALYYSDNTFDEYRISSAVDSADSIVVTCHSIILDLASTIVSRAELDGTVLMDFELLNRTPTDLLTNVIIPAAPSYFVVGTVNPTIAVDMKFDFDSPLSALRAIAQMSGEAEIAVRRNGTTSYYVDILTAIGSVASVVNVMAGSNIQGITGKQDDTKFVTRIVPKSGDEEGSTKSIADARWKVTSITASTYIEVQDPAGGDGPAQYADQFDNHWILLADAASTRLITDTVVVSSTTTRLYMSNTASITVNDLIRIRDPNKNDLVYLESPINKALYGLITRVYERTDLPGTRNLVGNPLLNGTYTANLPSGWTAVNAPTTAEETNGFYTKRGGKACKVTATVDAQGIECSAITILPLTDFPYFSAQVTVYVESGRVRFELVDITNGRVLPSDGTTQKAYTSELKQMIDVNIGQIDLKTVTSTSVKLRVVSDGGAAVFYVDSAQLTQTATVKPFFGGNAATVMWQAANQQLIDFSVPLLSYDVDVIDWKRAFPDDFILPDFVIGGNVAIQNEDMAISATVRVVQLDRDLVNQAVTQLTLSNKPADVIDQFAQPSRRNRLLGGFDVNIIPTVDIKLERDYSNTGNVFVTLSCRPASTASIYYVIQNKGDVPPIIGLIGGVGQYALYGNTFVVDVSAGDKQITAYAAYGHATSPASTWILDQDALASISLAISESPSGTGRFTSTPDADTIFYLLYRKKNGDHAHSSGNGEGWPVAGIGTGISITSITRSSSTATATVASTAALVVGQIIQVIGATQAEYNGSHKILTIPGGGTTFTFAVTGTPATPATGTITYKVTSLDEAQQVGKIYIQKDGGAVARAGTPLTGMEDGAGVGGLVWTESGYASGDVAAAIAVPVDRFGIIGGRALSIRTMAGTPSPIINSLTFSETSVGTDCGTPAQFSVAYSCSNTTSGSHDLNIYRQINGGSWVLMVTQPDPAAGSPWVDTDPMFYEVSLSHGGTDVSFRYKAEIVDTLGNVLDTKLTAVQHYTGLTCAP